MSKRYGTIEQRFWRCVIPEPNSGCWLWDGPIDRFGYGRFRLGKRKIRTHRLSYELHNGPIPPDRYVLHSCDIPCCTNPDHLRLGSLIDNVADKVLRNRQARGTMYPWAKLTDEDVLCIRAAKGHRTHREMAAAYGVSKAVITNILNGRKWTYLTKTSD